MHDKKDSTGICFIGERPFREFLAGYLPASPGEMRTPEGTVVGEHHGLMYYTQGQRQGLGVGGRRDAEDAPWYVAAKDLHANVLIVVQGEHDLLYNDRIECESPGWINEPPGTLDRQHVFGCKAKVRYRQQDQACILRPLDSGRIELSFEQLQRAVAPGQFAVFYDGDRCLGGASISRLLGRSDALCEAI